MFILTFVTLALVVLSVSADHHNVVTKKDLELAGFAKKVHHVNKKLADPAHHARREKELHVCDVQLKSADETGALHTTLEEQPYNGTERCDGNYLCADKADEAGCSIKCYGKPYVSGVKEQSAEVCGKIETRAFFSHHLMKCEEFLYDGCDTFMNNFVDLAECEAECDKFLGLGEAEAEDNEDESRFNLELKIKGEVITDEIVEEKLAEVIEIVKDAKEKVAEDLAAESRVEQSCDGGRTKFTAADRCNGRYICEDETDERGCQSKCFGRMYTMVGDAGIGPECRALLPRFLYNSLERKCELFLYGGCAPFVNNFVRQDECELECGAFLPEKAAPPSPEVVDTDEEAEETSDLRTGTGETEEVPVVALPLYIRSRYGVWELTFSDGEDGAPIKYVLHAVRKRPLFGGRRRHRE